MNLFVANWKMNKTRGEARTYARDLGGLMGDRNPGVELVIAPPFTAFEESKDPRGRWSLAAQDVASESEGAYTGEVSARMIADAGPGISREHQCSTTTRVRSVARASRRLVRRPCGGSRTFI